MSTLYKKYSKYVNIKKYFNNALYEKKINKYGN